MRWPLGLRSLRRRNFRLFFFGQLVSLIGSWMQTTAQQWLVYRITDSQLSLGVVTFAAFEAPSETRAVDVHVGAGTEA